MEQQVKKTRREWSEDVIWNEVVPACKTYKEFIQYGKQGAYAYTGRMNVKTGLRDRVKAYYGYEEPWSRNPPRIRRAALEFWGPGARTRFRDTYPGARKAAKDLGIYDEVTAHMPGAQVTWTPDRLLEAARLCETMKEFTANNGGAYDAARRWGMLDEIKLIARPLLTRMSEDEVISRGCRYRNSSEFYKNDNAAYQAAIKRDLFPIIFDKAMRRTREEALAEAEDATDLQDFYMRFRDTWKSAREGGFLWELKLIFLPSAEEIFEGAMAASGREDFRVRFRRLHQAADTRGVLEQVHAILPDPPRRPEWEEIVECALRHDGFTSFWREDYRAYSAALNSGQLERLIAEMGWNRQKWSDEELRNRGDDYETRLAFRTHDLNAYRAAAHRGLLAEICRNMPDRTSVAPDSPTWVYRMQLGPYSYIGITNDRWKRASAHREARVSHPLVEKCAREGTIHYLCPEAWREGKTIWLDDGSSKEIESATFDREEAVGIEEDQILAQVDLGLKTLNKFLNPQYDNRSGRWSWEDV